MPELQVRVDQIVAEAIDIKVFELVAIGGQELPPFTPGAHIDVHVSHDLIRQYSLCGSAADRTRYVIAVKREVDSRGGSRALYESCEVGATLAISHPRNNFPLVLDGTHHLLMAGGIGITPMLSMARHLAAAGESFALHYFSRSVEHAAFATALAAAEFAGRATFHHGGNEAAVKSILGMLLGSRPTGAHLYICGPRPFMDLVRAEAAAAWPAESVHLEHFSADPARLQAPVASFKIRLLQSGGEYTVTEEQTIVSALAEHEIYIDTSCEEGVCGTCTLDVVEGIPDHRDEVLSQTERESCRKIVSCVSRSKSAVLVVDL